MWPLILQWVRVPPRSPLLTSPAGRARTGAPSPEARPVRTSARQRRPADQRRALRTGLAGSEGSWAQSNRIASLPASCGFEMSGQNDSPWRPWCGSGRSPCNLAERLASPSSSGSSEPRWTCSRSQLLRSSLPPWRLPASSASPSMPHRRGNWPRPLPLLNPSRYFDLCGAFAGTPGAKSTSSSTATGSSPARTSAASPTASFRSRDASSSLLPATPHYGTHVRPNEVFVPLIRNVRVKWA